MRTTRPFLRFLAYLAGTAFCLLIAAAFIIQVNQHVFRRRAERLLNDFRSIALERASFADAQRLFGRWSGWGTYSQPCGRDYCDLVIHISDIPSLRVMDILMNNGWLFGAYRIVGGQPAGVSFEISVRGGFVADKSIRFGLYADPYELIGRVSTVPRAYPFGFASKVHPEYDVNWPAACLDCVEINVTFTPYASPADVKRLAQFNFDCLNGWHPCRTREDIMPHAAAQAREDNKLVDVPIDRRCDSQRIQLVARDAANAAVVRVISDKIGPGSAPDSRLMVVRLVEPLKRTSFWKHGEMRKILVNEEFSAPEGQRKPLSGTGSRLIILFDRFNSRGQFPELVTEPCGALQFTSNNLTVVQKGVREDFRPFPPDKPELRVPTYSEPPRPSLQPPTIN